jgi:hypothetical protein
VTLDKAQYVLEIIWPTCDIFWKCDLCVLRKRTVWDFWAYIRALFPNCPPLVKIASLDPSYKIYLLARCTILKINNTDSWSARDSLSRSWRFVYTLTGYGRRLSTPKCRQTSYCPRKNLCRLWYIKYCSDREYSFCLHPSVDNSPLCTEYLVWLSHLSTTWYSG